MYSTIQIILKNMEIFYMSYSDIQGDERLFLKNFKSCPVSTQAWLKSKSQPES